jgi:hypothetical protein
VRPPDKGEGGAAEPDAGASNGGSTGSEPEVTAGTGDDGLAGAAGSPGTPGSGGRLSNSGGRGGRGGSGGTQATPSSGNGGTNAPGASGGRSEGGEIGNAGSNAAGQGGSDPCAGADACAAEGVSCDGKDRIECVPDGNGCLVAHRTSCGEQACLDGECVDNGSGDSCDDVRVIEGNAILLGEDFATELGDQQDFVGKGCDITSRASAEAVLALNLRAGQTVLLRELGEFLAQGDEEDPSIDAVLGFLGECSDEAACLASTRGPDWAGVTYTAPKNETVYAFVGSEGNQHGNYVVSVEYTESLGRLGLGETVPPIHKGALGDGEWVTYVVELTEPATLYGDLTQDGTGGDLDMTVYNGSGVFGFAGIEGDEQFAIPLPAGEYRVEIQAFEAVTGYTLRAFTDPYTVLPPFELGDSFGFSSGRIPAGRSRFYVLQATTDGFATIGVASKDTGDPDVWLYDPTSLNGVTRETGLTEFFQVQFDQAHSSAVMRVEAHERGGDIPLHQVLLEYSATAE